MRTPLLLFVHWFFDQINLFYFLVQLNHSFLFEVKCCKNVNFVVDLLKRLSHFDF